MLNSVVWLTNFCNFTDTPTDDNGRWRTDVENPQYDDLDDGDDTDDDEEEPPLLQENLFPVNSTGTAGPLTVVVQVLQTTPESRLLLGEGGLLGRFLSAEHFFATNFNCFSIHLNSLYSPDRSEVHDSKVWKIVLVTVILLMSLVGSLGTAYYLCIWRGGRIHYQPQRVYA